jgi:hypothetical protein
VVFKECSHEEAIGRKGRGVYWDKRKDVMWIGIRGRMSCGLIGTGWMIT